MMPFCPSCGDLRDDDWRFCRGCGSERFPAPDASNRAFCTRCGELMGRDWKHCRACGFEAPSDPAIQSSAPPILPAVEPETERQIEPETPLIRPPLEPTAFEPPPPEPPPQEQGRPATRPRSEQAESVEESIRRRFAAAASQVDSADPMPAPEPEPEPPRPVQFELIAVPDLPEAEHGDPEEEEEAQWVESEDHDDADDRPEADAASFDDGDLPPLPDIPTFAAFPELGDQPRVELISPQSEVIDVEAGPFRESLSEARPWTDHHVVEEDEDLDATNDDPEALTSVADTDVGTSEDFDYDSSRDTSVATPVVASGAREDRSSGQVASALQILWLVAGTTAVLLTAALVTLNLRLEDYRRTGDFTPTETLSRTIDTVFTSAVIVSVVASLAMTVWWTLRESGNRQSRADREPRFTSRQIVAGWLIPIVNLVAPPVFVHHMWKRTNATGRINLWIVAWWVSLVTFGIGLLSLGRLPSATVEDSLDANAYAAITYGLLIVACLAAVGMVSSVANEEVEPAPDLK
ncbi:MAG: DUF4328 domain-containing protein [Acidimicrobiia bacterium]|nr:DUF4328 domain-containing protein [Acidimicrobiia bacterium]